MDNKEIYLDNSASTQPYDEVIEYMNIINRDSYGNPASLHSKGIEAERLIKNARGAIAQSIHVDPKNIYFTSGGTESNNLALLGYLNANPRKGKHIITTKIEHPSVLEVFRYLKKLGYQTEYIDVNRYGIIELDALANKIQENTALISIMHVNNEIGAIQPLENIGRIIGSKNKNTILHVDAVQAYGKLEIAPKKNGIDLMSISSHKIHGPKGVGALYIREGLKVEPIILGGGQEFLVRSGTENVPGVSGFGLAASIIHARMDENMKKVIKLKNEFVRLLGFTFEQKDYDILSSEIASPYIINVSFSNIKAEVLLHHLAEKGIYVSTGSACSSRGTKLSHTLLAMGIQPPKIKGAIRFSLSSMNSKEDIIFAVNALKEILPKIHIKNIYR